MILERKIKNKQAFIARSFFVLTFFASVLPILPFIEGTLFYKAWALVLLGAFFFIMCLIIGLIFRNRAKKMDRLLNGEKLLAHLEMDDEMLIRFANNLKSEGFEKSKAIMWVIGILFAIVTTIFMFIVEDDERGLFLAIIGAIVLFIFATSRFFPWYYYKRNLNGDKQILIGEKYAYFNGYFHNWDYPLSELTHVKAIKKPFRGIQLVYYYTDRTFQHSHEIKFPIPDNFDPKELIQQLRSANKK